MSNRALNWAFDSALPSGPRFVLVALADRGSDHSGEDWTCFPSVNDLIEMTGQGRSTVERHLTWLWAEGWISRKARVRADGTLGINDYTLHRLPETRARLEEERANLERKPGRRPTSKLRDGPSLKARETNPQNEENQPPELRGQEPSSEPPKEPSKRAREPGDDGFETAAARYPERGRKFTRWPAARAAWARAREVETAERLLCAVVACGQDPDRIKGDFGWPGFDVFLRDEIWRNYLPKPVAAASLPPRTEFAGPAALRADVVAYVDETFARLFLDRCAWDGEAGVLTPHSQNALATLRARVGHLFTKHGASLAAPSGA